MKQLDYKISFRWFVGLSMDEAIWDASDFSKERDKFLEGDIAGAFFERVLFHARSQKLMSDEHFTVDCTLIEAWAGQKSFKKKGTRSGNPTKDRGNPTADLKDEKRSNKKHKSTTDPKARLYKKVNGQEARLCYLGHVLIENHNGLAVNARITKASGTAERDAAVDMLGGLPGKKRITLGAAKAYDAKEFVKQAKRMRVAPHIAQNNTNRASSIDSRTTRHAGYLVSQRKRKRVEEIFGWMKTVGMLRKTRHCSVHRICWMFTFGASVYSLISMRNVMLAPT
jgi:hypothetical protein